MNRGRYKLTREDVAFCLEMVSDGFSVHELAYFVFGLSGRQLYKILKDWGAWRYEDYFKASSRIDSNSGKKYFMTRQDVAFTLEQLNNGLSMFEIAYFVFGVTQQKLYVNLKEWGVYGD